MKTLLLLATSVMLLSFSGCEREKTAEPTPINVQDLIGSWKLVEPGSYKVTLVIDPIFQTWEKLPSQVLGLSGESSVNSYTSSLSYKAQNQPEITISPISSTKKAGSAEAMQFEKTYYTNLKAVNRYELIDKNQLKFYYDGGTLVYEKTN